MDDIIQCKNYTDKSEFCRNCVNAKEYKCNRFEQIDREQQLLINAFMSGWREQMSKEMDLFNSALRQ